MWIVDRDKLGEMPNGTVFMLYEPDMLNGEIHIITGRKDGQNGYNGELSLIPTFEGSKNGTPTNDIRITNWATTDICDWEYDKDQKFAVFSKLEVKAMIDCLQWALSGCLYHSGFQDKYYYDDVEIAEGKLGDWTENLRDFGLCYVERRRLL